MSRNPHYVHENVWHLWENEMEQCYGSPGDCNIGKEISRRIVVVFYHQMGYSDISSAPRNFSGDIQQTPQTRSCLTYEQTSCWLEGEILDTKQARNTLETLRGNKMSVQ